MAILHVTAQLLCVPDLLSRHQVTHCNMVKNTHHAPGPACAYLTCTAAPVALLFM